MTARAASASRPDRGILQGARRRVVEEEPEPRRHLLEPIDRRGRQRDDCREEASSAGVGVASHPSRWKYGTDSVASRSGAASFR